MLLPDPLRNGCYTHHLKWSLSMAEEHPLILGAVVARAQAPDPHWRAGAAEAAILATLCDRTNHVDPWRDEQLGAGRAGVLTTVLRLRNHGVSSPKAKKTLRNRGKGPPFCFLNARVSL